MGAPGLDPESPWPCAHAVIWSWREVAAAFCAFSMAVLSLGLRTDPDRGCHPILQALSLGTALVWLWVVLGLMASLGEGLWGAPKKTEGSVNAPYEQLMLCSPVRCFPTGPGGYPMSGSVVGYPHFAVEGQVRCPE